MVHNAELPRRRIASSLRARVCAAYSHTSKCTHHRYRRRSSTTPGGRFAYLDGARGRAKEVLSQRPLTLCVAPRACRVPPPRHRRAVRDAAPDSPPAQDRGHDGRGKGRGEGPQPAAARGQGRGHPCARSHRVQRVALGGGQRQRRVHGGPRDPARRGGVEAAPMLAVPEVEVGQRPGARRRRAPPLRRVFARASCARARLWRSGRCRRVAWRR